MISRSSNRGLGAGLLVAAFTMLACSNPSSPVDQAMSPSGAAPASVETGPPDPVRSELTVCKFGADANFTMEVNAVPATGFSLLDGECALVFTYSGKPAATVTVTETPDPGFVYDSTIKIGIVGALSDTTPRIDTVVVTSSTTSVLVGLEFGAVLAFYNTPVPPLPASLGDFVWEDLNQDGIQDFGEPGIPGVMVHLYDCSNNLLTSTVTDSTGYYLFGGLSAGCYVVGFVAPGGYVFSPANQGGDPTLDSDADITTGLTGQITLVAGQNDLTWDAGLYGLEGGAGCTPGYWKQSHHFDSWTAPYTPSTLFSAVFEDAFPGKTLLWVLSNGGNTDGLDALGRHTVAALLNAASVGVSFDLTVSQVISQFNAVYPGTKDEYIAQKDIFEGFNTQGCPIN